MKEKEEERINNLKDYDWKFINEGLKYICGMKKL